MARFTIASFIRNRDITAPGSDVARIHPTVGPILDYGEDLASPSEGIEYKPRALLCSEAMTVTMVSMEGVKRTDVPLAAGYNPLGVREIHSISTGTIWGIK
jgi:hypothetical protein